jgi:hypothetical protein
MRDYRKLNSAEKAGWVTAWATAIQTVAVSGALAVALFEWLSHETQEQLKKREAVTKLFFEHQKQSPKHDTSLSLGRFANPFQLMIRT